MIEHFWTGKPFVHVNVVAPILYQWAESVDIEGAIEMFTGRIYASVHFKGANTSTF
jgi:hypothetical protein